MTSSASPTADSRAECVRLRRQVVHLQQENERLERLLAELTAQTEGHALPVQCEEIALRTDISREQAKEEVTGFVTMNPGSDAIDIANGLRLDLDLVEDVVGELAQAGILVDGGT